ncbi:hypothetical protein LEP1GSC058_0163 [Leptospira fainei serovar Hurstbridge str. BUT 6]|uniref:Uncharacterized protein n=1 Tax=Leptospira fainei serovar Hurstbridge str. BUT 6 TaxID=1193011 RepID=S3V0T2_9LEPT|nr:hypothetical protein LEP1GSC058_0163 [Leptospira fainei serovar Hurstbridge str. BUT 6]
MKDIGISIFEWKPEDSFLHSGNECESIMLCLGGFMIYSRKLLKRNEIPFEILH